MQSIAKIKSLLGIGLIMLVTACATTQDSMELLDRSLMAYEQALRWQDLNVLIAFHKNEPQSLSPEKRDYFKQFRVTGYNVVYVNIDPDQKHVSQMVEVKYHRDSYANIKDIMLNNRWEFDEATKRWQLTNPLPDFK